MAKKKWDDLSAKQKREAVAREAREKAEAAAKAKAAREAKELREANERQKQQIKAAAQAQANPAPALSDTYADGSRAVIKDGRFIVVDANGQEIVGAVVNGNRTYSKPVTGLTDLPAGSFDPSLIYQGQNANLGQLYNTQDFQTAWQGWDPDAQPGDLASTGRNVQDYWNQRSALAQALSRAQQDYTGATDTLGRNYQILGNNQLQSINQRGLLSGGALAQALAKRRDNQGREQKELDTSWTRYGEDNSRAVGDLTTTARRGFADGSVTLQRGSESNALYQGGLFATAAAQSGQSGMLTDNPNYQTHNGVIYQVTPDGARVAVAKTAKDKKKKPVTLKPTGRGQMPSGRGSGFGSNPADPWYR